MRGACPKLLVAEPTVLHHSGTGGLQQNIGATEQRAKVFAVTFLVEVENNAALSSVQCEVESSQLEVMGTYREGSECPQSVAAWWFHFHYVSTKVCEQSRGMSTRHAFGSVDHRDA